MVTGNKNLYPLFCVVKMEIRSFEWFENEIGRRNDGEKSLSIPGFFFFKIDFCRRNLIFLLMCVFSMLFSVWFQIFNNPKGMKNFLLSLHESIEEFSYLDNFCFKIIYFI